MRYALIVLSVFVNYICNGQEAVIINGIDCDIHGTALPYRREYQLNEYKNRYCLPKRTDYIQVKLVELINRGEENDFCIEKAAIVTGYVYNVKPGGIETCNCKTKEDKYRDTHIEITPDSEHIGKEYRIIVEVTPRMRGIMAAKGIDWSTDELKKLLVGHKVRIAGWLFFDKEHIHQAFATNPSGERNWRASCWEIHPVTDIKILD